MKRKLSLSFLKVNLKWQSNIFFSFWFPCFVFEIFGFVWYVNLTYNITLRHTLHNDLSQKIIYLCYCQTKTLNIYRLCCRRNTRTWFLIHQVLLFDNNKDIWSFATTHYAKCDVKLSYKLNLHIKQTKISQK